MSINLIGLKTETFYRGRINYVIIKHWYLQLEFGVVMVQLFYVDRFVSINPQMNPKSL